MCSQPVIQISEVIQPKLDSVSREFQLKGIIASSLVLCLTFQLTVYSRHFSKVVPWYTEFPRQIKDDIFPFHLQFEVSSP